MPTDMGGKKRLVRLKASTFSASFARLLSIFKPEARDDDVWSMEAEIDASDESARLDSAATAVDKAVAVLPREVEICPSAL